MEPTSRLRILVVEDEALIAENLRLTLEDLGYEVPATCYTFAEARAALAHPTPAELVLLDINLGSPDPATSGLALARQLRETGGPPFIFLTAYSDLATIREATQLQPSGYLIKPVSGPALFAAIQSALEYAATRQPAPAPTAAAPVPAVPDFFFVKLGERTHKLYWREVQRVEAGKNYVTLHLAGQRAGYPLRGSLTYVLEQLVPPALRSQFLRVNRQLALQAASITGYDDDCVYCGAEKYQNDRLSQQQLLELEINREAYRQASKQ